MTPAAAEHWKGQQHPVGAEVCPERKEDLM